MVKTVCQCQSGREEGRLGGRKRGASPSLLAVSFPKLKAQGENIALRYPGVKKEPIGSF